MKTRKALRIAPCALAFVAASMLESARADDAILVLDASGSMWGQIDGKSKVEIARAVVTDLLAKLPPERRLGLVAYGHRREGDCNDIEEIVPVGTDRDAIRRAVAALSFKGKTPLSAAVRFAAEKLAYTETKATVILVSDGAETCSIDPCVLGRELEAAGIDFTAHVIGFGLANAIEAAGLECLAEATGGRYLEARNAGELAAALGETVAAPIPPPSATAPAEARVVLRATELDGGPEITSGLAWSIRNAGGDEVFDAADVGLVETDVAPGSYVVSVVRPSDGSKGETQLELRGVGERTVTIPLEIVLDASLTVSPVEGPVGSKISVAWKGPNRTGDYVTIVKPGASVNEYTDYQDTARGNPLPIALPNEPGDYEVRYVLGTPRRVLASTPVKAGGVEAALTVPGSAAAGSRVSIVSTGPNYPSDWITVVKPGAPVTDYRDYFTPSAAPHDLEMPVEPGEYEVRYVLEGKRVLARAPITITDVTATLEAPASVAAGSQFSVTWTGPGYHSDWITVVKPEVPTSAYASYVDAERGSPISLDAAKEPGTYEIRYVLKGTKVIARRPIEVTAP